MAKEIKNYLKSVKDITAPLNWKSSPDSPPTQLAYITQPEIDMLVKANIHGSMKGKPNKGPKGIMSLDGMGAYDEDSVVSKPKQQQYESAGGASQSSFDQPGAGSMVINNVDYGQAYQDEQNISGGNNNPVTDNQGNAINLSNPNLQPTPEQVAANNAIQEAKKDSLLRRGLITIMGGAEDGNLDLTPDFKDTLPAGMHPLRKQYEYLKEKYGPNWANTTQAKVLEGYLSGVPVERGGGLGARDDTYGGGEKPQVDQFGRPIDPEQFKVAEKFRQQLLSNMGMAGSDIGGMNTMGSVGDQLEALKTTGSQLDTRFGFDSAFDDLRYGLSPEQYFNFNQQLMAADPSAENQAYKDARPFSSGAGLGALSRFIPGVGALQTFAGGLFPERDLSGFENYADYEQAGAGFRPLPAVEQSNTMGIGRPNFTGNKFPPDAEAGLPTPPVDPTYPFPVKPPNGGKFPFPVGITSAFDPRFIGPSFRGSPYTNRGVSPAFYEALRRFS